MRHVQVLDVDLAWPPETFLARRLEGLVAAGFEPVVATSVPRRRVRRAPLPGVQVVRLPDWRWSTARQALGVARWAAWLALQSPRRLVAAVRAARSTVPEWPLIPQLRAFLPLARLRPDLVHFQWNRTAARYLPMTGVWDCPFVTSCRGGDLNIYAHLEEGRAWVHALPAVFDRADAVHCVSRHVEREAIPRGLARGSAHLIPPAVDTALFRPAGGRAAGGPERELRVVAVGALRWFKGHDYALEAVRLLAARGVPVRLDLIGDRPWEGAGERSEHARVAFAVADMGLGERVSMHGRLAPATIRSLLTEADVLLHPSLSEGIPNAVIEAMACGVPVVATSTGGTPEAVTHGVEALLVEPRDAGAIAASLERLWLDPALRERLGEAGRRRAVDEFELTDQTRRFVALYEQLLEAPRASQEAHGAPIEGTG